MPYTLLSGFRFAVAQLERRHMRRVLATGVTVLAAGMLFGLTALAQPTDNPYRTQFGNRLPPFPLHWTDSLPWGRVVNIQDFANLTTTVQVPGNDTRTAWDAAFAAAKQAAAGQGGAVIYFPPLPERESLAFQGDDSSYYFQQDITLLSNMVLRGATPTQLDARLSSFTPPTYIEFPRYDYQAGLAGGTPNSTAFKEITLDRGGDFGTAGRQNMGVVYLDVNRGRVSAHPNFAPRSVPGGSTTSWAVERVRNILILGMRQNNVAIPDPSVPAAGMQTWDRYPWRFAANVDLFVEANAIVTGCRFNDYTNNTSPTRFITPDNFTQPGYGGVGNTNFTCIVSGSQATFDYNSHYGIIINRLKKTGFNQVTGFLANPSLPNQEPSLFARGIEIEGNYIFRTARAAIQTAGLGPIIRDNVIADNPNKETYLNPQGTRCQTNAIATYENTGIDLAGWGALIEGNTIAFYRTRLPAAGQGAFSADGQAVYLQGNSATDARDILVRNNTVMTSNVGLCNALTSPLDKGYSGIVRVNQIINVRFENNLMGGTGIVLNTNFTSQGGVASGNRVINNQNVRSINVEGLQGGTPSYVYGNLATTDPLDVPNCVPNNGTTIRRTCQVTLNPDSSQPQVNTNTGFTLLPGNCVTSQCTLCNEPCASNFPRVSLVAPASSVITTRPGSQIVFQARVTIQGCDADSVIWRIDGRRVALQTTAGPTFQQTITFDQPPVSANEYRLQIEAYKTTDQGNVVMGTTAQPVVVIVTHTRPAVSSSPTLTLTARPNPARHTLYVNCGGLQTTHTLRLMDLRGRTLQTSTINQGREQSFDMSALAPGLYLVEVTGPAGRAVLPVAHE